MVRIDKVESFELTEHVETWEGGKASLRYGEISFIFRGVRYRFMLPGGATLTEVEHIAGDASIGHPDLNIERTT